MRKHHRLLIAVLVSLLASWSLSVTAQAPRLRKTGKLKRADAAFRAGHDALQSGNLELARAKFAEASHLAPQIPKLMRLWVRFWSSWAIRRRPCKNSKPLAS